MIRFLVWLLTTATLAVAMVAVSCGGDEEEARPASSSPSDSTAAAASPTPLESPTATATGQGGGGDPDGTIVPAPSPGPGASVIPEDWVAYVNPDGGFKLRYPKQWIVTSERRTAVILRNWQPSASDEAMPPEGIKLDVIIAAPDTIEPRPEGATDVQVGSVRGWSVAYEYDPASAGGLSYALQAVLTEGGRVVSIAAMFGKAAVDPDTFWRVVSSFEFGDAES